MRKQYDIITLGEGGPPWTSMSQASMAKVMNAILRTGAELTDSYVSQIKYAPRCTVLYSIKVPSEKLEEFKKLVGYPIGRHPNIHLGMEVVKSVKQVIYDLPEEVVAQMTTPLERVKDWLASVQQANDNWPPDVIPTGNLSDIAALVEQLERAEEVLHYYRELAPVKEYFAAKEDRWS